MRGELDLKRFLIMTAAVAAFAQTASAKDFLNWPQNTAWQVDTGVDYSSGSYGGSSDTTVFSVPIEGKIQLDRFRLEGALPYLDVRGPGIVSDGVVVGSGPVSTRTGIGDLNLGAAYLLSKDGDLPSLEIEGIMKAPTAASGLGTGKYDYTLQANLAHAFSPQFMLFGSLGYQWLNSFSTFTLKSGVQFNAGVNYALSDQASIGVSANYHQEYLSGLGDVFTVSPYVLWTLADHWRLSGYGTLGSGKASPNYGLGMRLIYFRS